MKSLIGAVSACIQNTRANPDVLQTEVQMEEDLNGSVTVRQSGGVAEAETIDGMLARICAQRHYHAALRRENFIVGWGEDYTLRVFDSAAVARRDRARARWATFQVAMVAALDSKSLHPTPEVAAEISENFSEATRNWSEAQRNALVALLRCLHEG